MHNKTKQNFQLITVDNIYCKYSYAYGQDWTQVSGIEEGISPTAQCHQKSRKIVLNTPLEATFTSANPFRCLFHCLLKLNIK